MFIEDVDLYRVITCVSFVSGRFCSRFSFCFSLVCHTYLKSVTHNSWYNFNIALWPSIKNYKRLIINIITN